MAGINLIKRLKEQKSGAKMSSPSGGFGGFGGGSSSLGSEASDVSSGDKLKIVLMLLLWAGAYYGRVYKDQRISELETAKKNEIAAVDQLVSAEKSKMTALKSLAQEAEAYERQMAELQRKLTVIESLGKNKNLAVRMVDFIVSEMPANVWLQKMNLDTKLESKVDLQGNATSMQVVSEFMKRLEGAVFFPSWQLVETKKEETALSGDPKKKEAIPESRSFQLNAKVVPL